MINVPFTTFDKSIRNNLEDIFLELVKLYKQKDSFAFHFIGLPKMVYLQNTDLIDFPDEIKEFKNELLYLNQKEKIKALDENFEYSYNDGFCNENYLTEERIDTFLKEELIELPNRPYNEIGGRLEQVGDEILSSVHFPNTYDKSTLHYEVFKEPFIISNYAYLINSCKAEIYDSLVYQTTWTPNTLFTKLNKAYKLPVRIIHFLSRKLFYFRFSIDKYVQETRKRLSIKTVKKTIKYLISYFQKIIETPSLKVKIIEGIKFPKSITNQYLSNLILLLKKEYHIRKGDLLTAKFLLIEPQPLKLKASDSNISDRVTQRLSMLTEKATAQNAFYFPNKLFWDTEKNGDLKSIFYELNNPKYLYKGKKYMEIKDIDQFVERNFTFEEHQQTLPKNQISLPFNSFIGPIRQFLYSFRYRYYHGFQGELFAQMLRDNFYDFYQKQEIDLSLKTLTKIASNMHKGSHKINIILPFLEKK